MLNPDAPVTLAGGAVQIENQPAESVRVIKLIDNSVAASAPSIEAQVPGAAATGETVHFSVLAKGGAPAVGYHWDFGDGTGANGARVAHTYTRAAEFTARLSVAGVDGEAANQNFSLKVSGGLRAYPNLTDNRRFVERTGH